MLFSLGLRDVAGEVNVAFFMQSKKLSFVNWHTSTHTTASIIIQACCFRCFCGLVFLAVAHE